MKDKREGWIDLVKGFGIIAVVARHTVFDSGIKEIDYWYPYFMISVFYCLIGLYRYEKEGFPFNVKSFLKHKLKVLGKIYLFFSILIIFFDTFLVVVQYYDYQQLLKDGYRTLCLAGIGTLWFIPTLLISDFLLCYLLTLKRSWLYFNLGVIFIIAIGGTYLRDIYHANTMMSDIIFAPILVFLKGFYGFLLAIMTFGVRKLMDRMDKRQRKYSVFVFMLTFISFVLANHFPLFNFNHLVLRNNPVVWLLVSFITCLSLILLCELLYPKIKNLIITKVIIYYGKNSLILMCTHLSITLVILDIIFIFNDIDIVYSPFDFIVFVAILLLTVPIIYFFNKYVGFLKKP